MKYAIEKCSQEYHGIHCSKKAGHYGRCIFIFQGKVIKD